MQYRVTGFLAAAVVMAAADAHSQAVVPAGSGQAAAAKPAPGKKDAGKKDPGKTVEGVTVTGASQNGFRSSIDRRSYGVANDLATTTGSISDALRNIPSVEVDISGAVSLRGDSNVTIMIDGKPSNMFKGPGGGAALQALPADQIERVEVITNPSAQFSPEGSAGIINLITKQVHKAGRSGSLRANVGGAGRRNLGISGAYNSDKLTLSADAAARHDPQHSVGVDTRTSLDPVRGVTVASRTVTDTRGPFDQWNARLSADYDLDARTRISGEVRHNDFTFDPNTTEQFTSLAPGAPPQVVAVAGIFGNDRDVTAGQVSLRRKFAGDDHVLTANLSRERTNERPEQRFTTTSVEPVAPDVFQDIRARNSLTQTEMKADYSRPMAAQGRLKAGYDLRIDDNDYDNVAVRGASAASAAPDPSQTNLFRFKQTVNAAYVTYEQPFGDWTALAGLRLEEVQLNLDQVTTGFTHDTDYFRAYPSLHLAYKASETQQWTLSYSERVQRPTARDLNPFRYVQTFSAEQGNPNLQPQLTQSFEAGWQLKDNGTFYLATLYYRQNEHGVTDVVSDIGGGVLLTTKANLSQSRNAGLELVANGRLTKTLSYNVSTNLYWNQIDAPAGLAANAVPVRRQAFAAGGRGSLNWQVTSKDLVQVNAQITAKRLLPQGFTEPMFLTFLGYRHKFSDSLSVVVTASDPIDSYRFREIIDTSTLHEHVVQRGRIQTAYVGLAWTFGSGPKRVREPGFDFGG